MDFDSVASRSSSGAFRAATRRHTICRVRGGWFLSLID